MSLLYYFEDSFMIKINFSVATGGVSCYPTAVCDVPMDVDLCSLTVALAVGPLCPNSISFGIAFARFVL